MFVQVIMFAPYCYKPLVTKCDYVLLYSKCKHFHSCCSLNNKYYFMQFPALTRYFHSSIISFHFIHSPLMTHFTRNNYYHSMQMFFFLFIGQEPTTWPANNCLQITVCSCAMSFNCFWLHWRKMSDWSIWDQVT